jgi:hypothetical protein
MMKPLLNVITLLLSMVITAVCFAAPTLTTPSTENVGANIATLLLQSSDAGTGYFTLLSGSNADCGTGNQVSKGLDSLGNQAFRIGSLPLSADTTATYTIRNLAQDSAYTVCFTADSSGDTAPPTTSNIATSIAAVITNPGWSVVGNAGFSPGMADYFSLSFSPQGIPYLAYRDHSNVNKAVVMKYNADSWAIVGLDGLSDSGIRNLSQAFAPDGTLYIAFYEGMSDRTKIMKFSEGSWTLVGNIEIASREPALAISPDGTPYIAYQDGMNGGYLTVMKFSAESWNLLGNAVPSNATNISLAFAPDGTPYIAYSDSLHSGKATVIMYNNGWSLVGNAGFSAGQANPSLAFNPAGTPYVAYCDGGNNRKATVMKYSSGAWSLVGPAGFSNYEVGWPSLAFSPDGTPYIATTYIDGIKIKAMVMNYSGGNWSPIGRADFYSGDGNYIALAFAPDGTPYMAYTDGDNNQKATVMKLINSPPIIRGTPTTSVIAGTLYSFTPTTYYADNFSISGTLPPGLSFSTTTGKLSGTPNTGGTYNDIVITASNSIGSVSLPAFTINVGYELQVSITGAGCVTLSNGGGCIGYPFVNFLNSGSSVSISPSVMQGSYFSFSNWTGCDSVVKDVCFVTMNQNKSVSANFDLNRVKVGSNYYDNISSGYNALADGDTILAQAIDFTGNLIFDRPLSFLLQGGHDGSFITPIGTSTVIGSVTIAGGTVTIDCIVIR